MEIKEFYDEINGDYEGTLARLMKEERILKYLLKFKDDQDYNHLLKAIDENDYETAFRASHNLKGICSNLGMTDLTNSSANLCEEYRHNQPSDKVPELLQQVKDDYKTVIGAINKL